MKRMQFLWHSWLMRLVPLQLCSRCWQLLRRAETWLISHLVTASSWQMSTACTLSSLWTTSPSVRRNTSSFLCYCFPLDVHVIKILWSDNEMHHLRLFSPPSQVRCMVCCSSTTAQSARVASVGGLISASTPSSTGRSGPPRRQMTATGARPDSTSLQTAVKVRWLMSHHSLLLEDEAAWFFFWFFSAFCPVSLDRLLMGTCFC